MEKRYPITMMCAACIPWTGDLKLDETAFRRQVKHLVDHDAKSIYILGTAGEGYALNREVFAQVAEAFLDECGKKADVMPMVGIISTSMMEMMDRIAQAASMGCRDFQVALPCWGALSDDEVIGFFKTLSKEFPDSRFIHYNNGARSKTLCTIDLYVELAREVPNLVAAKYSTANIYEIYGMVTTDCPIAFYLVDAAYAFGAAKARCGLLNSFASLDMELAWRYFHAGQNKDLEVVSDLGSMSIEIANCFRSLPREFIDSAYDKTVERVADPAFSNSLYPPYTGLSEPQFEAVDAKIKAVLAAYRAKHQEQRRSGDT